jgi:hypothetical protein
MSGGHGMSEQAQEEQRLAEYLKRAVPQPPAQLSPEEIALHGPERSRKAWAMPVLAAAAVVALGVAVGAVATHHPATRPPASSPAADQSGGSPAGTPSAQPTASCQPRDASIAVPNVVGMSIAQAEATIGNLGFVPVASERSSTAPAGAVIRQSPAPGAQLARGTVIDLIASSGSTAGGTAGPAATSGTASSPQAAVPPDCPTSVTVPSVIGMRENQAIRELRAAGFTVTVHHESPAGPSVSAGEVWNQTPIYGSEAPRGTVVTLDVAT